MARGLWIFRVSTYWAVPSPNPALALVSIVIVLMSFEFRLGNHFDFSGRNPEDFGAVEGNEPDRAYAPRKSRIKSNYA